MKIPVNILVSRKKSGFAVVIALVAVVVLTIMAGAFAYSMKVETRLAANTDKSEQLLWMGRGGMDLASYVLSFEVNQPYNSLNQVWAGGPGSGPETNTPVMKLAPGNIPSLENYPIGGGWVSVKIIDLDRKINVNTASPQLLQQVLTTMGVDASDISVASDSILDWIDPDDATRPAGAESDYYQGLNPPYFAKNAPIDDLSELMLIKGITTNMYEGAGSQDNQGDQDNLGGQYGNFAHHKLGFGNAPGQDQGYAFALTNVFTPYSSGKININTADATVLSLIPGMDTDSAQAILKWRAGPDGADGTEDDLPFTSPSQIAAAGVNPAIAGQVANYCSVRSTTYEVHVTAHLGDQSREFVGVIFCYPPNNAQVVRFYWND